MKTRNLRSYPGSDPELIFEKIGKYCAYQDRCIQEVEVKLREWRVPSGKTESLVVKLKEEGFINEERYARSVVRGKFRNNDWGRVKIRYFLKGMNIPTEIISSAMEEIPEETYRDTVHKLIRQKMMKIKNDETVNPREKIINFVVGKGFEFEIVTDVLKELKQVK